MSYNVRTPLPTYSVGTISGTSGSNTVTGVGTNWTYTDSTGNNYNAVAGGDVLIVANASYIIASVNSATSITLQTNLVGTLSTGTAYTIVKYSANLTGGVMSALSALMAMGSDTSPDTSFAVDNGAGRIKLRIGGSGDPQIAVGATGAADSALATALDITQAGVVSMTNGLIYSQTPARRNAVINGQFDIWQGGTSFSCGSASYIYTADQWVVYNGSGVTATVARVSAPSGFLGTYAINVTATSVAAAANLQIFQRFEAQMLSNMDSKPVTVSFDVNAATTAGSLSCSVLVLVNSGLDSGSFSNQIFAGTVALPAGSGRVSVSMAASQTAGMKYGAELILQFTQTGASGNPNISVGSIQMEIGSLAQPFEKYALPAELAICQRYYEKSYSQGSAPGSVSYSGALNFSLYGGATPANPLAIGIYVSFKMPKRAIPTLSLYSPVSGLSGKSYDLIGAVDVTPNVYNVGDGGFQFIITASTSSANVSFQTHFVANSRL